VCLDPGSEMHDQKRSLPIVGVRCGSATRICRDHMYICHIKPFAFNVGAAFPGDFERPSNGLFSDKVFVLETKDPIVMDQILNEIEFFWPR
jgi:hypothetical protein